MKPSLVVLNPGKQEGKSVPIPPGEFHIGRDPRCQLRPTNPAISKLHCVLFVRDGTFYVRDLKSTNGTFVNDQRVEGDLALAEGDQLRVGPILFGVRLGLPAPVDRPTPLPRNKVTSPATEDLEAVAAELLALGDEPRPLASSVPAADPGSDTTTLLMTPPSEVAGAVADQPGLAAVEKAKPEAKPKPSGDTCTAAKDLLDRYMRRNRR